MSRIANLNAHAGRAWVAGLILLAACSGVMAKDIPSQKAARSVEERLRAIEDEQEIRGLLVRYGQYLDALNLADFSQLFAREGTWSGNTSSYVPVKGPANIRAMLEKAYEKRVYDAKHITNLHVISNVMITVQGDRAIGYSKWTVTSRNDKDEPYIRQQGHYEDEYIREDGRWKFLSRLARRDIP